MDLATRMKGYEAQSKTFLNCDQPIILRLDGCHFHTFTKGMKKPFDEIIVRSMIDTTKKLCESIQNCVFGYTQSDEITLVLCSYLDEKTETWFNGQIQKMCSVAAAIASNEFNSVFRFYVEEYLRDSEKKAFDSEDVKYSVKLKNNINEPAIFDCRAFNIPVDDVSNNLYWRELDCVRNSVQACAQTMFSVKELTGLSCAQLKEKMLKNGFNWDAQLSNNLKYGTSFYKEEQVIPGRNGEVIKRKKWQKDINTPIFKNNWEYLEKHFS